MPTRGSKKNDNRPPHRPATTLEGRENQLVNLAVDLAERQMLDGTASSQVVTHFLKLGTTREKLEQERLTRENELLTARVKQLGSIERIEELYKDALKAMSTYSGRDDDEYDDDDR